MLRRALVWVLQTPARLALVATALLVAGLALVITAHRMPASRHETGQVVAIVATPSPSGGSVVSAASEIPTSAGPARTAARHFLHLYLGSRTNSGHRVNEALQRWVTPQLWVGLRLADTPTFPQGRLDKLAVETSGAFEADFVARLDGGSTLTLAVVRGTHGWLVSDVEPGRG